MGKEIKRTNLSVKQKLEFTEKLQLGISVALVCKEHGHLDLREIRQYRTPGRVNCRMFCM
jgi:hypothetical protein